MPFTKEMFEAGNVEFFFDGKRILYEKETEVPTIVGALFHRGNEHLGNVKKISNRGIHWYDYHS